MEVTESGTVDITCFCSLDFHTASFWRAAFDLNVFDTFLWILMLQPQSELSQFGKVDLTVDHVGGLMIKKGLG